MTYFNLRKRATEPDPGEPEDDTPDAEQPDEETVEEQPAKQYGPLLTGLLGPSQWIAAHLGSSAAWAAHLVAVWAPIYYGGWAALLIPAGWLLAVLAFVPREHLDQLAAAIERRFSGRPNTPPPSTSGEAIRSLLYTLIGEGRGVHLRTVLAHLQEHGQWEGKTVADLRQHLEALHIPVRPKVKVDGTPTRGVLKADLDALPPIEETSPSPAPSPTV
ncbi:hypothetical protein AB0J81_09215 [Streptomyces bobili]|uniref:hypothetical protein n=1 Tax=Streptomyces bobili TaxID=67280 RepID=UPI003427F25B